jgi:hypothetical protein
VTHLRGDLESDSLGGTFVEAEAAGGGTLHRAGTAVAEVNATDDVAQLVAQYTAAVRGATYEHADVVGGEPSAGSSDGSAAEDSEDAHDGSGSHKEEEIAWGGATAAGNLQYQALEDDSDSEYDEEAATADMAMQAAALGGELQLGHDTAWDDASSSESGGSGAGGSDDDLTFHSLLASSLSPVPEGVAKQYGATLHSEESSLVGPSAEEGLGQRASSEAHPGLEFGRVVLDAAGSFSDSVMMHHGQWLDSSPREEQGDCLSGTVGGGEVVREHAQKVQQAVRSIESGRRHPLQ